MAKQGDIYLSNEHEENPHAHGDVFGDIDLIINGGGSDIATGVWGYIRISFDCEVVAWSVGGDDAANAIVIDIWQDTHANYPPTVVDTMIATGTKPNLANEIKGGGVVDWSTTTITAGNWLGINVDSVGGAKPKRVTLHLKVKRT